MAFMKREMGPVKVYEFGCRPIEGENLAVEQLFLANRCRNSALEAKKKNQELWYEQLAVVSPVVRELRKQARELYLKIEAVEKEIQQLKVENRTKKNDPAKSKELKLLKADLRELRASLRAAEKSAAEHEEVVALNEARKEDFKAIAQEYGVLGLGATTKDESIAEGTNPKTKKFRRFTGEGVITLREKSASYVPSVTKLLDNGYKKVQLHLESEKPNGKQWYIARIQLRPGVYATFRLTMHRQMPTDGSIRRVMLVRKRQGPNLKWFIQFMVENAAGFPTHQRGKGAVAIDFGWRKNNDGTLTVMTYCDAHGGYGQVKLPPIVLERHKKVFDIQAIRDNNFNQVKSVLKSLKAVAPEWMLEDIQFSHTWKVPYKLWKVFRRWRDVRFDGDSVLFDAVSDWYRQDLHLYRYQEGLRARLNRSRNHFYKNVIADMSRMYGTLYNDTLAIKKFKDKPPVGTDDDSNNHIRRYSSMAACGMLRLWFLDSGLEVVNTPCEGTSTTCHVCGVEGPDSKDRLLTCPSCGLEFDRDIRACINLLQRELGKTVSPRTHFDDKVMEFAASRERKVLEPV